LKDNTGSVDGVVFPEVWKAIKNIAYKGNVCLITGYTSDKGGLVVKKVKEL
jgi:hypothetical protein